MKRLLLFIVLFSSISLCVNAQYVRTENQSDSSSSHSRTVPPHQPDSWEHFSLGGNFSLSFGTVTYIVIAPLMNYHLNKNIVIGAGPFYQYESVLDQYGSYSSSIYGARGVGMCFLPGELSKIFLQAEYDILNVPNPYSYVPDARSTIGIPLLGGGYKQTISDNAYFTLAILFDLSNSPLSPYYYGPNTYIPVFLAGFDISL
jgi:hypothetical protein